MATPNSLALELLKEMEFATDDTEFVARVEKRVNDGLDEIAVATEWNMFRARGTFDTVIGLAQYKLPQGGREIIQLRYIDTGEPITLITIQEAARRGIKLEDPGRARAWLEDGNVVEGASTLYQYRLAPVPDSVLTIEREWFYHPSEVATDAVMPIQDQYLPLIRRFVRASLHRLRQQYDAESREIAHYDKLMDGLVKREKRKVAKNTQLKASDLRRDGGRPQAMFDRSHFDNEWL